MAVTPASFRAAYQEFTDPGLFPDAAITTQVAVALQFLNAQRWGNSLDFATTLWVAHFMALSARDARAAEGGGVPGAIQGILTSKSVDKVSVSYDPASVSLENQGFWGLTRYGLQLLQFARMFGAGGIQLGSGPCGQLGGFTGYLF